MPTCPNGHQSGSEDWCEVCGHRMATGAAGPAGAVPPPPPPPPAPGYGYPQAPPPGPDATAQAELCPQCRTPREAMAPFCEECRWNFLTNTATSYTPLAPQHRTAPPAGFGGPGAGPGGPGGPGGASGPGNPVVPPSGLNLPPGFQAQQGPPRPPDPYEYQGSRPSQLNRPAEPLGPEQPGQPAPGPASASSPSSPPSPPGQSSPAEQPPQGPHQQGHQQGPPPPPPYQQGPPPPPAFQQQSAAPPAPPRPQSPQSGGDDDWMLSPPAHAQGPQSPPSPAPQAQFPQQGPGQQYPEPAAPAGWTAVIAPDREYFMAMMTRSGPEATGLNLPAYSPEQHLPLSGSQVTIGRRRHSTGESPDIDLSVPPEDPGVSHQHAILVHQPDGSWAVVDQNSTNGTTLNGGEDPIQPYVPIPLKDGDRVHVGAWTTITIRRG
ncbi:FHA domain-containing protein [Streptomyces sp. NPDC001780]